MFDPAIYRERRNRLKKDVGSGLILLLGNDEVGMNYAANTYHFRQDSTFLYFFAVDLPGLAAADRHRPGHRDALRRRPDGGRHRLDRPAADHRRPLQGRRASPRPRRWRSSRRASRRPSPQGRRVHFLKPYRAEHTLKITALLGLQARRWSRRTGRSRCTRPSSRSGTSSRPRRSRTSSRRSACRARCTSRRWRAAKPGKHEYEVVAEIIRVAKARGCDALVPDHLLGARRDAAQPSTREPDAGRRRDGARLGRRDAEQERERHHAHDSRRRDVHRAAARRSTRWSCSAQLAAIAAIKPGVPYKDVHLLAREASRRTSRPPA